MARIQSGVRGVNAHPGGGPGTVFGGVKRSGLGVEGGEDIGARTTLFSLTNDLLIWKDIIFNFFLISEFAKTGLGQTSVRKLRKERVSRFRRAEWLRPPSGWRLVLPRGW